MSGLFFGRRVHYFVDERRVITDPLLSLQLTEYAARHGLSSCLWLSPAMAAANAFSLRFLCAPLNLWTHCYGETFHLLPSKWSALQWCAHLQTAERQASDRRQRLTRTRRQLGQPLTPQVFLLSSLTSPVPSMANVHNTEIYPRHPHQALPFDEGSVGASSADAALDRPGGRSSWLLCPQELEAFFRAAADDFYAAAVEPSSTPSSLSFSSSPSSSSAFSRGHSQPLFPHASEPQQRSLWGSKASTSSTPFLRQKGQSADGVGSHRWILPPRHEDHFWVSDVILQAQRELADAAADGDSSSSSSRLLHHLHHLHHPQHLRHQTEGEAEHPTDPEGVGNEEDSTLRVSPSPFPRVTAPFVYKTLVNTDQLLYSRELSRLVVREYAYFSDILGQTPQQ